jgi:phosphohistidine phosphatase
MPEAQRPLLLIIRHAAAEDAAPGQADLKRALTARGKRQALDLGRFLRQLEVAPQAVLTSPAVRARETAEIVARHAGTKITVAQDDVLLPGARPESVVARLQHWEEPWPLALVGHEPDLGALAALLAGGAGSYPLPFKKAGVACLELVSCAPGGGRLLWFLPPKLVRQLLE